MSKLAQLAAVESPNRGVAWEPPPEVIPDLLAARANGYGWDTLSKALRDDGIDIGKGAIQGWFDRYERAQRERAD